MPSKSEQAYRGWKVRITEKTRLDSRSSATVEVWKPGHDPRSHAGVVVPFLKRAASWTDAEAAALEAAKKWIDREVD